jgi:AraC-like DNA-binding protein
MSQISNTVFFCDKVDFDFSISSYAPFHLIQVDVSADWLSNQLGYPDFKKNLENIFAKADHSFILSYSSYSEHRLLHHIDTTMYTEERNNPALVATVLQLLSELMSRLTQNDPASKSTLHTVNYDKVAQVEDIISKNLAGTLPSLEWIARHSTQSVSSLMRHFKYVHGKTIYEYYLEKKMELAMKILSENAISVNEVADKLGYEKASSFITIFKKYYGHCPGAIKQRAVLN